MENKKVRMVVEFDINGDTLEEKGKTVEEVVEAIEMHDHDTIDGFEVFPQMEDSDLCSDFFLSNPTIVSKEIVEEKLDATAIEMHLNNLKHELNGALVHDPDAVPMIEAAILDALNKLEKARGESYIQELIYKVKELNGSTPNGAIRDADTLLYDTIEEADFEITGIAECILLAWEKTSDKKAVEEMFYIFTNMHLEEFLEMCINKITREMPE